MTVSIAIILDTRRIKKTNRYPLKLRVTFERNVEYYSTIYDLSKDDYEKFSAPRISTELHQLRAKLQEIERKAKDKAGDIKPFSFIEFEKDFVADNPSLRPKKCKKEDYIPNKSEFDLSFYEYRFSILKEIHPDVDFISATFHTYIVKLLEEGRIGSALNYQDTYNSLKRFRGNIRFSDITVPYLIQYERWMIDVNNCSRTTVGIKLRPLRAIFNEAIANGIIRKDKCYPFGRRKYQIPASRNMKKALDLHEIEKIYNYQPVSPHEKKAKDYWMFCYLGNGMNPKDFAHLKFKDIDGEYLRFIRAKTERATRSDIKPINVYITEDMWQIIDLWGNKDKSPNNYIFPIFGKDETNLLQKFNTVKGLVKFINDGMAAIAKSLNIDKKVTNIVSRHTFSTVLKRSGASTEFIQESLGHTDKKTTENYLDSFDNHVKKEFANRLIDFKGQSKDIIV